MSHLSSPEMAPKTTPEATSKPPDAWLGVLGVLVVLSFAGFAVFEASRPPLTTLTPLAHATPAPPDTPQDLTLTPSAESRLNTASAPTPLYLSETGAHTSDLPGSKSVKTPGPQATSLFDSR